jgi:2'-deoxymugineic-acid 2'-dioxygenase/mugineic-acid 3-dioxygenase
MADNMLLVTQCHESNPDSFILAAGYNLKTATSAVVSLPVIDMSRGRDEVRRAILDAGKELGFFQASYNIHA